MPVWLFLLILAPVIGSFLGVIVRRLGTGQSIIWARSNCENCGVAIAFYDLVPLVSFLQLKGRCRHCRSRISFFHPAIEISAILVAVWAMTVDSGNGLIASCLLGWMLLGLALCDIARYRLPDGLTLPLLLAGLGATAMLMPEAVADHALAAALAYGLFRTIGWLYQRLRGLAGLGQGDAKLLAASGAWLGLFALPNLILIAAASALIFALLLKVQGRVIDRQTRLPFGPFIALATWLLWLYGPQDVFKFSPYLLTVLK
ncbi:prepilin peptidase [Acidisoma cellulosilytica]|uniref:Prepilin leader peptidase/N-methyltransferase n=1 Tax=Acidisoma cellulosilyticum TaxID=2802395 RepID=A0A963Z5J5_9PROT|nr:A24 family peptidase [Acidisoma cellulosilyticum]MCB8883207.1 prepilin peptidase [Acidisoma cellulosilyticum]